MIFSNAVLNFCIHSTEDTLQFCLDWEYNNNNLSILVNAADNKQRDKNMSCIKVTIDV